MEDTNRDFIESELPQDDDPPVIKITLRGVKRVRCKPEDPLETACVLPDVKRAV